MENNQIEKFEDLRFTKEELIEIHTAICSDAVNICFPPRNDERLRVATSVSRKIFKLLELCDEDTLDS